MQLMPLILVVLGIISITGLDVFGSAFLEGAAWKQNVMYGLIITFAMLPPEVQKQRLVWMGFGGIFIAFFYGFANAPGSVALTLFIEKILFSILILALFYRLYKATWETNRYFMALPVLAIVSLVLLFPIKDENIAQSSLNALIEWDKNRFTSDHNFHIYLGLFSLISGICEWLMLKISMKYTAKSDVLIPDNV